MNSSNDENHVNLSNFLNNECVNIYVMWYRLFILIIKWNEMFLFKKQIISGDYFKTSFLVQSAALFIEIMPRASTQQGLLFRKYKCILTRRVNAKKCSKAGSRANVSKGEVHNIFQVVYSSLIHKEMRFVTYEFFF